MEIFSIKILISDEFINLLEKLLGNNIPSKVVVTGYTGPFKVMTT